MTYIIAEIGCNHNGDFNLAKEMVRVAKGLGVDSVKFQTFKAENLVTKTAEMADYQKDNIGAVESQYEMTKKLELSFEEYAALKVYAESLEIDIFSTAFDMESLEFLISTGMEIFKIPSGELTNLPYLKRIAEVNKKIIISTGMADISEIDQTVALLKSFGADDVSVLHCTTDYPTASEDVNLRVIPEFIKRYPDLDIGYSDHTIGYHVPVAAVALGAVIIEKHFTLDKSMPGPDHVASATPDEIKEMVKGIREIELALGSSEKKPTSNELKNRLVARKSIITAEPIKKGELLTESNLTIKRPGTGISPLKWFDVLGQVADRDFESDEVLVMEGVDNQNV